MNLNPFKLPTLAERAKADLALAELELLQAHEKHEHAAAMLGFHSQRVARLRALVAAQKVAGEFTDKVMNLPVVDAMKGGAR